MFSVAGLFYVAQANLRLVILLLTLQSTSTIGTHHPAQLQSCILEFSLFLCTAFLKLHMIFHHVTLP